MKKRMLAFFLCAAMTMSAVQVPVVHAAEASDLEVVCEVCGKTPCECPVEEQDEDEGPQIGDIIWIKRGSLVLKDYNDTTNGTHTLIGNYEVKIKQIILDEEGIPAWYEFEFQNSGFGEAALVIGGYKYVEIANTSVTEPEETEPDDQNVCNCTDPSENIADHAESCPRRQYCGSLVNEKNAEEIYTSWADYDETLQNDLLNYLNAYDQTKYEALKALIDGESDYQETIETITATMDSFAAIVDEMPEADKFAAFDAAVTDFAEIHALVEKDMPLPDLEIEQYEEAYLEFAGAMGYESDAVEITYPDETLEADLAADVMEALYLLEEAESLYASLQQNTSPVMTLTLDAEENASSSVVDMDENYAAAKAKLDAILEVKPELVNSQIAVYATDLGNGVKTVDAAQENIKMNLFNYGPQINTQVSGYGMMPFVHSEGAYGWAVDSSGNNPSAAAGGWPVLNKMIIDKVKFPHIKEDKNNVIKQGSLGYLFDPNYFGTGRIDIDTYQANILSATYNPYQYGSVYFPVKNNDGSGTGLFQKEGEYFVYDSGKNAAWYNPATQKFELYNYVVRPAYTVFSTSGTNGNFLPFNQGHTQGREDYQSETYSKEYSYKDSDGNTVEKTATVAKTDTVTTKPSGALTAYRLFGNSRNTEVDLWFGMNLEFDFYQPAGGLVDGAAMEFDFHGDDDVFVYIDNVLILDIGGTHGAQTGIINFATGAVTNPEKYGQYGTAGKASSTLYDLMKAAKGDSLDDSLFIDSDKDGKLDTFADFTKHNLKFYYMERGGNISYCRLKFNMDPLPTGSMSIQKDVEGIGGNIDPDENYTFKISATPKNSEDTINTISYTKYNITNTSSQTKDTVANNGTFTLKHNEKIVFDLAVGTEVTVEEQTDAVTADTKWRLNGEETQGKEITYTIREGEAEAEFLCTNTRSTGSLMIKKEFAGTNYTKDLVYTLNLAFGEDSYTGPAKKGDQDVTITDGVVQLKAGESLTIHNIPTGMSYTLSENSISNGYLYASPTFNDETKAFGEDYSGRISATANQTDTIVVENRHVLADLTVDKSVTTSLEDTDQSFLFHITGGPGNMNMKVIVQGDGSITLNDLPAGTGEKAIYTVTELTDWSWRYEFDTAKATVDAVTDSIEKDTIVSFKLTSEDETVTFKNKLDQEKWLSDECYCENWWGGGNNTVVERDKDNKIVSD